MNDQKTNWPKRKNISVVVDTVGWFDPFAQKLAEQLDQAGHHAKVVRSYQDVGPGDLAFYLSCMKITPQEILDQNNWNIVVHASDLPKGKGFSPVVWQILAGQSEVPVTMISMAADVDSGQIFLQEKLTFEGHELNDEIRQALGDCILEMCMTFVNSDSPPKGRNQVGEGSWYDRRRPNDSALDPKKTIAAQFNLMRVVDNDSYPAFFDYMGYRYQIQISKIGKTPEADDKDQKNE